MPLVATLIGVDGIFCGAARCSQRRYYVHKLFVLIVWLRVPKHPVNGLAIDGAVDRARVHDHRVYAFVVAPQVSSASPRNSIRTHSLTPHTHTHIQRPPLCRAFSDSIFISFASSISPFYAARCFRFLFARVSSPVRNVWLLHAKIQICRIIPKLFASLVRVRRVTSTETLDV